LAAKRAAPRTSLGALFAAATLADLLWPLLLLTGWEHVTIVTGPNPFLRLAFDAYPLSHSLLLLILWGAAYAALYRLRTGYARGAVVLALLVVSHWVLDVATHRPDMPLYPGSAKLGLGLWTSVAGTLVVEGVMFVAGVVIYGATTTPRDAAGRYGFWALVVVLAASYAASLFGPPPPSVGALAIFAVVFGVLFVVWGWWADRHRDAVYSS
jgi:hypothetical protein